MTENKRFTYRYNGDCESEWEIIDLDDDAYYGMDTTENCVKSLVKLLNELFDENEQLKQKEMDFLEKRYAEVCYLKNKIDGLEKENEQLKQLIKKVLETTPIEHSLAIDLKNSIRELYE